MPAGHVPIYPLIGFVLAWVAVTTVLSAASGWFSLMRHYPNVPESPVLTLGMQSGSVGNARVGAVVSLSVCPSGLRIGMLRVFGPFCRPVFVPWDAMRITRQNRLLWKSATISIGHPPVGTVTLPAEVANRLARAAANSWPEPGPIPVETSTQVRTRVLTEWAVQTGLAAAFFFIVPRLVTPSRAWPPIAVAILFPAIVFGAAAVIRYLGESS
jgi:hypothetical protein